MKRAHPSSDDEGETEARSGAGSRLPVVKSFEKMGLKDPVLQGVYAFGFEKPSAIQQRTIPAILGGRHVIAQSQSGTGKTSLICVLALQLCDLDTNETQVLVLNPTRELAQQTCDNMRRMATPQLTGFKAHACVGGTHLGEDIRALEQGCHVVSGTPGRVFDMVRRAKIRARGVKLLILDEADELLSLGFKEQIYDIYRYLLQGVQLLLISATLTEDVLDVSKKFMKDPVRILVRKDELTLEGIRQFIVNVEKEEWKFDTLCDLYGSMVITQAVVFVNSRSKVEQLSKKLRASNFTVSAIHGEMPQTERDTVMQRFRDGDTRVLVATDLFARGIDVHQVSLVVNYDLPLNKESYLHRIGRSGRYGRKGTAISLVTNDDQRQLADIERFYRIQIAELPRSIEL